MIKRVYTPEEKKIVRRLLLIHEGNVSVVHHLTGFPLRTIRRWRGQWDDDYDLFTNALAETFSPAAKANHTAQQPAIAFAARDSALAEPAESLTEYAQLRQKLMEHTNTLTDGLLRGDGMVHQRVQAISRLLDRILTLDEILPTQQSQQQPQSEMPNMARYIFDGGIHKNPPWHDTDTLEGARRRNERYLRGLNESFDQQLSREFPEEYEEESTEPESAEPEPLSPF